MCSKHVASTLVWVSRVSPRPQKVEEKDWGYLILAQPCSFLEKVGILVKNINFNSQLDDLWKYIKVKTYCWRFSPLLPVRKGAKPHLKCGAWAVSLGSEMWAFNPVVSPWNEAAANESVWTKVSSNWESMKSKQARWQIANKHTASSVDGDSVHEHRQWLSRVVEVTLFVSETLTACRCSFQTRATHSDTSWLGLNVGLPGCLFGFCFVCLLPMPAWYLFLFVLCCFFYRTIARVPKLIAQSQRVQVSFSIHQKKQDCSNGTLKVPELYMVMWRSRKKWMPHTVHY